MFFLLVALHSITTQLERHSILAITMDILTEAAQAIGNLISAGLKVIRWVGKFEGYMRIESESCCYIQDTITESSEAGRGEFGKEEF